MQQFIQGTVVSNSTTVAIDSRPISSGIVSPNQSGPLWGGCAVQIFQEPVSGFSMLLAEDVAQICGFTTFSQASAMVSADEEEEICPWGPVPTARASMAINCVLTGSGAKLVLAADPGLLDSLRQAHITTPLSWDFANRRVTVFSTSAGQLPFQSIVELVRDARVVSWRDGRLVWENGAAIVLTI